MQQHPPFRLFLSYLMRRDDAVSPRNAIRAMLGSVVLQNRHVQAFNAFRLLFTSSILKNSLTPNQTCRLQ